MRVGGEVGIGSDKISVLEDWNDFRQPKAPNPSPDGDANIRSSPLTDLKVIHCRPC